MEHADQKKTQVLDFPEYFSAQEAVMNFEQYVKTMCKRDPELQPDYVQAKSTWDAIASEEGMVKARTVRASKAAEAAVQIAAKKKSGLKVLPAPVLQPTK